MKILALAALLSISAASPFQSPGTIDGSWRADLDSAWTRNSGERWVSFQMEERSGRERRNSISIPVSDLQGLGARGSGWASDGEIRFSIKRDAGTVDFTGAF